MSSNSVNGVKRNQAYYLETVIFKVDDELFHLPSHIFINNSQLFGTTFSLEPGPGVQPDGQCDEQPFELAGVTKEDFELFLKVIYPLKFPADYSDFTQSSWLKVINIATMWDFLSIREFAIKQIPLESIASIDKIIFGEQYGVIEWFYRGMLEILGRKSVLEVEEAEKIPLSMVLRIQKARERILSSFTFISEKALEKVIREHFGNEVGLDGGHKTKAQVAPIGQEHAAAA
ncbi:hypothetical protein BDQ17DRAFT_1324102 [Cyathus striatus]|nr:hypothetical protein BDQ17DRAFT_1324102 [Cyathus striatus]